MSGGSPAQITVGVEYGTVILDNANEPKPIFGTGVSTRYASIKASADNSDQVFLGWDSDVEFGDGIELSPTESFSLPLDVTQQQVWAVADDALDRVYFITGR